MSFEAFVAQGYPEAKLVFLRELRYALLCGGSECSIDWDWKLQSKLHPSQHLPVGPPAPLCNATPVQVPKVYYYCLSPSSTLEPFTKWEYWAKYSDDVIWPLQMTAIALFAIFVFFVFVCFMAPQALREVSQLYTGVCDLIPALERERIANKKLTKENNLSWAANRELLETRDYIDLCQTYAVNAERMDNKLAMQKALAAQEAKHQTAMKAIEVRHQAEIQLLKNECDRATERLESRELSGKRKDTKELDKGLELLNERNGMWNEVVRLGKIIKEFVSKMTPDQVQHLYMEQSAVPRRKIVRKLRHIDA